MIFIYIASFAVIAIIDLIPLIRRRKPRAVAAFVLCFAVALTLALLSAFEVQAPSIMKAWKAFFDWIGIGYKP